ncbi:MAG: hypothetical protein HY719_00975, partial [Planctomycetes bacterium]|nr:hypothetical protein [Planctomycetota bacterium]
AREMVLTLGEERLGKPAAGVRRALNAIDDHRRLRLLARKVLRARSWRELLGGE